MNTRISGLVLASLLVSAVVLGGSGCPKSTEGSAPSAKAAAKTGPESAAALAFIKSVQAGDLSATYELLSPQSRETLTEEEFAGMMEPPSRGDAGLPGYVMRAKAYEIEQVLAQEQGGSVTIRFDGTRPVPIVVCREQSKWWADFTDAGQIQAQVAGELSAFIGGQSPFDMYGAMYGGEPGAALATLRSPLLRECKVVSVSSQGDRAIVTVEGTAPLAVTVPVQKQWRTWSMDWGSAVIAEGVSNGDVSPQAAAALKQAQDQAATTVCQSNLKQLALGLLMYTQDYDERFPPAERWEDVIQPYVKNTQILACPGQPGVEHGYAFNRNLSMKPMASVQSPAEMPALFDSSSGTKNASDDGSSWPEPPRHGKQNDCAYVDGHVKLLSAKPSFGP